MHSREICDFAWILENLKIQVQLCPLRIFADQLILEHMPSAILLNTDHNPTLHLL